MWYKIKNVLKEILLKINPIYRTVQSNKNQLDCLFEIENKNKLMLENIIQSNKNQLDCLLEIENKNKLMLENIIQKNNYNNYQENAPSIQNVINIFDGQWASKLPLEGVTSGGIGLFSDNRIKSWNNLCPVKNKRILELGPLECAHTYMLEKLGAASVTSIESSSQHFLKCLIVKELFDLKVELLHGDFREYLKNCEHEYDIVLASGVLYHMVDPIQLIHDIAKAANNVFVWTHYYSEERTDINTQFDLEPIYLTEKYRGYKQYYGDTSNCAKFYGGTRPYSVWLKKNDIFSMCREAGFENIALIEDNLSHPNGNCVTFFANKNIKIKKS